MGTTHQHTPGKFSIICLMFELLVVKGKLAIVGNTLPPLSEARLMFVGAPTIELARFIVVPVRVLSEFKLLIYTRASIPIGFSIVRLKFTFCRCTLLAEIL